MLCFTAFAAASAEGNVDKKGTFSMPSMQRFINILVVPSTSAITMTGTFDFLKNHRRCFRSHVICKSPIIHLIDSLNGREAKSTPKLPLQCSRYPARCCLFACGVQNRALCNPSGWRDPPSETRHQLPT